MLLFLGLVFLSAFIVCYNPSQNLAGTGEQAESKMREAGR